MGTSGSISYRCACDVAVCQCSHEVKREGDVCKLCLNDDHMFSSFHAMCEYRGVDVDIKKKRAWWKFW